MLSFGKVNAAAVHATQEFTAAAASLNFDFALVKIEAPPEFQALGHVLSRERRKDAEDGVSHTTARKLAALFEPLLSRTPELIKAYGSRASEIASAPEFNPRGSERRFGLFAKQFGADATSIWAAATSGPSAIAVHLLGCMLARIWDADEATSIWAELVEERRSEIRTDKDATDFEQLARNAAASQEITRGQLAQWDASARSWLQCADQAKGIDIKHKQFLLMLKNISLPVNTLQTPYRSVLKAWNDAMRLSESLISGQPQQVHDGAALLGLSAWHLYPDLVVVGEKTTRVAQKDPLVRSGGTLTLGLYASDLGNATCGISWSLPLAALNFYGDPVVSKRSLDPESVSMTMREVAMVALGSILPRRDTKRIEFFGAAECLVALWAFLKRQDDDMHTKSASEFHSTKTKSDSLNALSWRWLRMLADSASDLLKSEGLERERFIRLVMLGRTACV